MVVSVFKELAGRGRDDGVVKTVRRLLAGSGGLASNSQIWFCWPRWGWWALSGCGGWLAGSG
jgi:hypothetical protein